jgi:NhaP-type Na+/H+ or K+/H+ antiporter
MDGAVFQVTAVVAIAVGATWAAARLRIPSIVLLLTVGVIAGAGFGLLDPDATFGRLLSPFVSMAVGLILFEGGLSLRFRDIKGNHRVLWLLVSVGVLITWFLGSASFEVFVGVPRPIAVLLGAILVVSGPTVISPILRTVRPSGGVSSVLKWESIVIDPIGAGLAVLVAEFILASDESQIGIFSQVAKFAGAGILVGVLVAIPTTYAIRRHLIPERLVPLVGLAAALIAFAGADGIIAESGLLATTVLGLALANNPRLRTEPIIEFSEVIQVLLVGVLFVVLSARLTRDQLGSISLGVLGVIVILGLIARPLGVAVSTWGTKMSNSERIFLAGVAPRGIVAAAVASVFALDLEEAGVEGAELLTPLAFAVIVATVIIYGFGAGPLARRLGLAQKSSQGVLIVGAGSVERELGRALSEADVPVVFASTNRRDESELRLQGFATYYGNLVEKEIPTDLDLSGIGRLLAVTPNDEVNTLSARRFTELFGSAETYQLAPQPLGPGIDRTVADIGGRRLFNDQLSYSELDRRFRGGEKVRRTSLGKAFTGENFKDALGEGGQVLFVVKPDRLLVEADGGGNVANRASVGDTILWLPAEEEEIPTG